MSGHAAHEPVRAAWVEVDVGQDRGCVPRVSARLGFPQFVRAAAVRTREYLRWCDAGALRSVHPESWRRLKEENVALAKMSA